jgi:site-specific recombinase XerD
VSRKRIPLNKDAQEAMKMQLQAFREKFGREPGPDDPVFFDPDQDAPTPLTPERFEEMLRQDMKASGRTDEEASQFLACWSPSVRPCGWGSTAGRSIM